jgi:hypothetical protein
MPIFVRQHYANKLERKKSIFPKRTTKKWFFHYKNKLNVFYLKDKKTN